MGKLDLSSQATAFTNLVGVAATGTSCNGMGTRVVASDADMSLLYTKVTTPTCGSKMPLGETPLTSTQADDIKGWINAGAMNN
jgi:3D (Asp-Asp-Asp) domain-containing protein